MRGVTLLVIFLIPLAACAPAADAPAASAEPPDERVRALADVYIDGYFQQFPESPTYYSLTDRPHDRLNDQSPGSIAKWQAREDEWLAVASAIDPATIESRALRAA
jgi:uncharacterized protein (DUF885 family)